MYRPRFAYLWNGFFNVILALDAYLHEKNLNKTPISLKYTIELQMSCYSLRRKSFRTNSTGTETIFLWKLLMICFTSQKVIKIMKINRKTPFVPSWSNLRFPKLTLSWWRPISYRNQSNDLLPSWKGWVNV